ncbi:hypothetical protein B0T25DRAFT_466605 [Lasiosphaeria hispida]|uniref:Uncharacterized protein n=1 Tax=Lasiosphaeria hispida TaxID=260671 RepID=A0AAJ0M7I4_9PEZI|nr:hypothetical protein B0T25DRAFT_466605 [Lasiosphaeria hispida]
MISGFLTSTLTQQAVTYPVFEAESHGPGDKAEINRATTFSAYDGSTIVLAAYDSVREQQAIFSGAFQAPADEIPPASPICSSGECYWPPYGSMAICGGVANLTSLGNSTLIQSLNNMTEKRLSVLFNTARDTSEALGYGDIYFQIVPQVYPIIIGILDKPTNAFNASVTSLMASDSFIAYTDELLNNSLPFDTAKLKYLEVAFWWCTKTFETNVTAGKATTHELSTRSELEQPLDTALNQPWNADYYLCYTQGTCNASYGDRVASLASPPGSEPEEYTVHLWTGLSASALLATSMFDSVFMDRTRGNVASNGAGIAQAFGLSILGDFLTTSSPEPAKQMGNVRRLVGNVAKSTTNLLNKTDASAIVIGTVKTPQVFVEIRWEWMAMVAAQLVLTLLFLGMTVVTTHRAQMQVIKCSSLAMLCALDRNTRDHIGGINDLEGLKRKAKCLAVRLQRGGSGIALWLGMQRDGRSGSEEAEEFGRYVE